MRNYVCSLLQLNGRAADICAILPDDTGYITGKVLPNRIDGCICGEGEAAARLDPRPGRAADGPTVKLLAHRSGKAALRQDKRLLVRGDTAAHDPGAAVGIIGDSVGHKGRVLPEGIEGRIRSEGVAVTCLDLGAVYTAHGPGIKYFPLRGCEAASGQGECFAVRGRAGTHGSVSAVGIVGDGVLFSFHGHGAGGRVSSALRRHGDGGCTHARSGDGPSAHGGHIRIAGGPGHGLVVCVGGCDGNGEGKTLPDGQSQGTAIQTHAGYRNRRRGGLIGNRQGAIHIDNLVLVIAALRDCRSAGCDRYGAGFRGIRSVRIGHGGRGFQAFTCHKAGDRAV